MFNPSNAMLNHSLLFQIYVSALQFISGAPIKIYLFKHVRSYKR